MFLFFRSTQEEKNDKIFNILETQYDFGNIERMNVKIHKINVRQKTWWQLKWKNSIFLLFETWL